MALSDDPGYAASHNPRRRAVDRSRGRWSDSQKIEAVTTYMILGSLKLVAGALKIPFDTLKTWKKTEWWKEIETDLRVQEDLQLSNRLKKIVERSFDVVEDRLEHGDFFLDNKGNLKRKPVAMKDAHKVAMDMAVRRDELIDRHVQNESISTDKIEKKLGDLAAEFARIASQVTAVKPVEVTDVIFAPQRGNDDNAEDDEGREA